MKTEGYPDGIKPNRFRLANFNIVQEGKLGFKNVSLIGRKPRIDLFSSAELTSFHAEKYARLNCLSYSVDLDCQLVIYF